MVTDLQVAYLALGRVGPIVSRVRKLDGGGGASGGSAVVELLDQGAGGRLTTVINARAAVGAGRATTVRTVSEAGRRARGSITAIGSASTSASSAGRSRPRPAATCSPRSAGGRRSTTTSGGPAAGSGPEPC